MLHECRNGDNQEGVEFFSYCLRAFEKLGSGGMSEDEDGVDKVLVDERELEEAVKLTMFLPFRHSTLMKLVALVDEIPQNQGLKKFFVQSGRVCKRRVRGDPRCKTSDRKPPKRWHSSFFPDGYLESLSEYQREKLRVSKKVFPLYDIETLPNKYL
ncbi:MAG: hypothetical protein NXY57DRAFT_907825 [Lentinula lateritia]|nr:MAG: hypothetical protein NXY57DRAFT_907825 [Lentinula lateritia]